jgi:hypothetical protein
MKPNSSKELKMPEETEAISSWESEGGRIPSVIIAKTTERKC